MHDWRIHRPNQFLFPRFLVMMADLNVSIPLTCLCRPESSLHKPPNVNYAFLLENIHVTWQHNTPIILLFLVTCQLTVLTICLPPELLCFSTKLLSGLCLESLATWLRTAPSPKQPSVRLLERGMMSVSPGRGG